MSKTLICIQCPKHGSIAPPDPVKFMQFLKAYNQITDEIAGGAYYADSLPAAYRDKAAKIGIDIEEWYVLDAWRDHCMNCPPPSTVTLRTVWNQMIESASTLQNALAKLAEICPSDYPLLRRKNRYLDEFRRLLRQTITEIDNPVTQSAVDRAVSHTYTPMPPLGAPGGQY